MNFKTAIANLAAADADDLDFDVGSAVAAIAAEVMGVLDDKDYAYVAEDLCDWLYSGEYSGKETAKSIAAEYMAY